MFDSLWNSAPALGARQFLQWWQDELLSSLHDVSLPGRTARPLPKVAYSVGDLIQPMSGALCADQTSESWERLSETLCSMQLDSNDVDIIVSSGLIFHRRINLPPASVRDTLAMVNVDMMTATPFTAETAVWGCERLTSDGDAEGVGIYVLKRQSLDKIQALAKTAGIFISGVYAQGKGDAPGPLLQRFTTPTSMRRVLWQRINACILILFTVGLIVAALGQIFFRMHEITEIQAQTSERSAIARNLRDELNRREETLRFQASVAGLKDRSSSVLETWALLTELLPQDTWIGQARLSRKGGMIEGFSVNAASLIALMEQDPHFQDVKFATPVRIDPATRSERFEISFRKESSR